MIDTDRVRPNKDGITYILLPPRPSKRLGLMKIYDILLKSLMIGKP